MSAREPLRGEGPYRGPTYYDQPAVKSSSYGALVWTYTWLAGLGGSAQLIAGLAALLGRADLRGLVRQGRSMAVATSLAGAGLLIADLRTPQRFYNMLRIFRGTSPMSIGTYLLCTFGASSLAARLAGRAGHEKLATAAQVPAAVTGAGMSVYTGALLGATSTPLWSAEPQRLTGRFGASAFATAAAALSVGETLRGHGGNAAGLQRAAAAAAIVEYGFARSAHRRWRDRGLADVLDDPEIRAGERASAALGVWLPLACLALNELAPRRSRALTVVGAAGVLAGGLVMRATMFRAGNRSAESARDAFAMTADLPDTHPPRRRMGEARVEGRP